MVAKVLSRYEGRLFVREGKLCLVVETNDETGRAVISFRENDRPQTLEIPIEEIARRLSRGTPTLDNAHGPVAKKRVSEDEEGWYFSSREGKQGPFPTADDAERRLGEHVVATQDALSGASTRRRAAGSRG